MTITLPASNTAPSDGKAETMIDTEDSADQPRELDQPGEADREGFVPAAFIPDTAEKVDWVLGKIADARAGAARIRENAEAMARDKEREAEHLLWLYGPALQEFTRKQTEGTKKKSVRLFHGVLGYRTKPAAFAFEDCAARAWASQNAPEALRLDRRALEAVLTISETGQAVVRDTGEVLTFATISPAEEVFYTK